MRQAAKESGLRGLSMNQQAVSFFLWIELAHHISYQSRIMRSLLLEVNMGSS